MDIKYLLYANVNFLRNFYTPNYYLFVFVLLFCWEFFSFLRGRMEDWILSTGISCIQMYIHWETSIHPIIFCLVFFCLSVCLSFFFFFFFAFSLEVGGWGCWRIGYTVFIVYKCLILDKLLYTQLLFACWFFLFLFFF